jgi:hypothetical protein
MNESLRLTALFIRDLLTYQEQLIRIGRLGEDIEDFTIGYIGIDSLGAAQRLASGELFNGTDEEMTYGQRWTQPVTLTFYGDIAWTTATRTSLLIKSQKSLELQEQLGLSVYQASSLTDVKIITGQQFGGRVELALNIQYSISAIVDTLRIDTAHFTLLTE